MLVSRGEMAEGPQCITESQMDRGSNRLVLTCEFDGPIEIVLQFLRLADNAERPGVAGVKFGFKTKASPMRKASSIGVGQGNGKKVVSSGGFDVLPEQQVAEGITRER